MLTREGHELLQEEMEERIPLLDQSEEIFREAVIQRVLDCDGEIDEFTLEQINEEITEFINNE